MNHTPQKQPLLFLEVTKAFERLEVQRFVKYYPTFTVFRPDRSHFIDEELKAQKHKKTWSRSDPKKWNIRNKS